MTSSENRATILTWRDYNVSETDDILNCKSNEELIKLFFFSSCLLFNSIQFLTLNLRFFENHLKLNSINDTDKIIINYFCRTTEFCKENNFTKKKLSTLLSILLSIHIRNIGKSNDHKNLNLSVNYLN